MQLEGAGVGLDLLFQRRRPRCIALAGQTRGIRLDIAAGTAVRFEPGQTREVTLVALDGMRMVYGFRQDVMGKL